MSERLLRLVEAEISQLEKEIKRYGAQTMAHNHQRASIELSVLKRMMRKAR